MSARINIATFDRMCAERGKSPSEAAREMGLGSATLAKIRRGDAVSQSTIDKAATWFANVAAIPGIGDLLRVAS